MDKHDIEKIGVREFRSELPKYLYGQTPVEAEVLNVEKSRTKFDIIDKKTK